MADHSQDPDAELTLGGILWTAAGTVIITVVAAALMWLLGDVLRDGLAEDQAPMTPMEMRRVEAALADEQAREAMRVPSRPTLILPDHVALPPGPNLELVEGHEIDVLRVYEEEVLDSYGWVDEAAGTVRIPIDRALEMAAQGQLGSFSEPTAEVVDAASEDEADDAAPEEEADDG
ncbi:MAG: hypothetical protein AAF604_13310 [Acidobacteriota bacterium]